ncbi:MAG: DUF2490 domain-containing protein [Bacteroidales bacterium]|jgi:hypothetical protein|nr:DUF2490 domain-containing protein [Bacteroidales bacterium]
MKTRYLLLSFLLLVPALVRAQGTVNALENDFATRTSVEIDKKLARGLHLSASYELRTENALTKIDRHQVSLGLDYKFNDWLKGGIGYTFYDRYGTNAGWQPRHRASARLTFGYRIGDWRFSLREMLQLTHKTEDLNAYQEVRNPLTLKTRFKVQYKGFDAVEPYVFFELKNILNDPACTATYNTATGAYSDYAFTGYTDSYINRYRGGLGLEWKLDKHNALEFYGLFDYCYDKNVDTNKEGTKLKSLTYDQAFITTVGVGYKFSF